VNKFIFRPAVQFIFIKYYQRYCRLFAKQGEQIWLRHSGLRQKRTISILFHSPWVQFETRRHFSQLEQNGQIIDELLNTDAMVYTYVNKDYYTDSSVSQV
jgi:hypothetical protein